MFNIFLFIGGEYPLMLLVPFVFVDPMSTVCCRYNLGRWAALGLRPLTVGSLYRNGNCLTFFVLFPFLPVGKCVSVGRVGACSSSSSKNNNNTNRRDAPWNAMTLGNEVVENLCLSE